MRLYVHVCLVLLLPLTGICQQGYMKNGKVYKDGAVYCSYKETGYRISTMTLGGAGDVANPNAYPEAIGDAFKDYSFGTEYQSFITAKAKVFASAREVYMVYFYNIRFETLERELNLRYNPLLIRKLAQDIVKYDVINGKFINEKNALKLIEKWNEKAGILNKNYLDKGVVNRYNSSSPNPADNPQTINIRIEGDKIFRNDTLMGRYMIDMHLAGGGLQGSSKNSNLYRIDDAEGNLMAWVKVPLTRSVFFLAPAGEKESLSVVTTDRDERKIIASAAKVLTVHKMYKGGN